MLFALIAVVSVAVGIYLGVRFPDRLFGLVKTCDYCHLPCSELVFDVCRDCDMEIRHDHPRPRLQWPRE